MAGRVGEFMQERLQNFNPHIDIIPARKRGTPFSPDNPQILQPLLQADIIFMGARFPDLCRSPAQKQPGLGFGARSATAWAQRWFLPVRQ